MSPTVKNGAVIIKYNRFFDWQVIHKDRKEESKKNI